MKTLRTLVLGDPGPLAGWLERSDTRRTFAVVAATAAGLAIYGATVGWWRSPKMGGYVAVKMPMLIACTLGCNALLNGLFGMLLGSGLGIRRSMFALLMSFCVAALILGSLAPVTFFLAWNAPAPDSPGARGAHAAYLLTHTFLIGYAGVVANVHLHRLLRARSARRVATATLLAWLGGNAFLGAQFSWILRPFFGSPQLDVAFLRPDAMQGSFYETVWLSMVRVTGDPFTAACVIVAALAIAAIPVIRAISEKPAMRKPQFPNEPRNRKTKT